MPRGTTSESADSIEVAVDDEAEAPYLLLKSAGIPAFLKSSKSHIQYPNWTSPGERGDVLMVPHAFLAQAQDLLSSRVSDEDLAAQAEAALPPSERHPSQ
jgi:hypothetical protein